MGKKDTTSTSTTATTTENKDQRILAEMGSTVIGAEAQVHIESEFGDNVANAFDSLLDFARDAGQVAVEQSAKVQDALTDELQAKSLGQEGLTFIKTLPYIVAGIFAFGLILIFKKK